MKLNLGAGRSPLPGYENLDIHTGEVAYPLTQYADGSVDEIRASHILEHYSHTQAAKVLAEWVRVLKPGGKLFVAVPDFERISRAYLDGKRLPVQQYLMGGHVDEHDHHGCLWDRELLTEAMEFVGLRNIEAWQGNNSDCSTLPISLNLVGTKEAVAPYVDEPGPFEWLRAHVTSVYAQHGEDGAIAALLDRLPPERITRRCIEIGSADGVFLSNTRALIERRGYEAVWCEKDIAVAERCKAQLDGSEIGGRVTVCAGELTAENAAEAFGDWSDVDVLSIDVDGQELNLWTAIHQRIKPHIAVIEFDTTRQDADMPAIGDTWQHGLPAVERYAAARGYQVVAALGCNAVCVRNEFIRVVADPAWVAAHGTPTSGEPDPDHRPYKTEIAAVMSMPRLAFTDNMFAAFEALIPLRIQLTRSSGVFWNQCLTEMIEDAISAGFKYVLTIDYDTVFTSDDVKALYRLMEAHPEADAICAMQQKRSSEHVLFTKANEDGTAMTTIDASEIEKDLLQVTTAHFGLTLLRCAAFADLERPWFGAIPDDEGRWTKPKVVDGRAVGGHMDADIAFWKRFKDAGKRLYQANRVVIGHMQLVVTWPGPSLAPVHQLAYDYSQKGKPTEGIWQ